MNVLTDRQNVEYMARLTIAHLKQVRKTRVLSQEEADAYKSAQSLLFMLNTKEEKPGRLRIGAAL